MDPGSEQQQVGVGDIGLLFIGTTIGTTGTIGIIGTMGLWQGLSTGTVGIDCHPSIQVLARSVPAAPVLLHVRQQLCKLQQALPVLNGMYE